MFHLLKRTRSSKRKCEQAISIPRGRHTYGPQPELVGPDSVAAQLAEGSKIGNFCSIAPGLRFIFRGKHMVNWVLTTRSSWAMTCGLRRM
jgi:hypothetical protein